MASEHNTLLIEDIENRIASGDLALLAAELQEHQHPADIAEILISLDHKDAVELLEAFDKQFIADVIIEMDEDERGKLLADYSSKEIAEVLVENLDSDDAADIISELSEDKKREVLSNVEDVEHARQVASLLAHAEGTAGSLMATELIKVRESWTVTQCVREMRRQAEEVETVYAIYVVDDSNHLLGSLSLKKLLTISIATPISEVYDRKIRSVTTTTPAEEVAQIMQKYDLHSIPVTDSLGRLLGRITVDDVVDVITEEAERDYQMASGLTDEVEDNDSLLKVTRIRLPWLVVGLVGGLAVASIVGLNEGRITAIPQLAFFIPLIAAMGGNVGVQSSAIVVKALANKSFGSDNAKRLFKEFSVGMINGVILAILMMGLGMIIGYNLQILLTVSLSLLCVIVFASLFGTFVPLMLDKLKIDPAVATGPFITTSNDVLALFIYFYIGRLIIG
jgi:magnesium transporter